MNNTQLNSNTASYKRVVGTFKRREDVEDVLRAFRDANFDMDRVSLLARHVEEVAGAEDVEHGNEAREGAGIGATTGTVLGGLGGFLVGVGLLAVPGVGPILAAGAEISAVASTLAGAGIGAASGGIIGALVGLGIPEEDARTYNDRIQAGEYVLMVRATQEELRRAEKIMRDRHVRDINTYDAPAAATSATQAGRIDHPDTRKAVTDTRDIDNDGKPEVIIVDKREEVR